MNSTKQPIQNKGNEVRKLVKLSGKNFEASSKKSEEFSQGILLEGKQFWLRKSDLLNPKKDFEQKGPSAQNGGGEKNSLSSPQGGEGFKNSGVC
ncbi:hypothetical protein COU37_03805 [Candidatus Micrarchaeota archaeon CG10_big_fil_rev_8_21_14_0_10_45_29]|nr:MAG: hypothetical protein COU37_03805 [Candidatus Micrarchaeota archaeon CG10_big_fil_rev_8_21_14_0_10_45_29]